MWRTLIVTLLCGALTGLATSWGGWRAGALVIGGIMYGAALVAALLADLRASREWR